MITTIDSGGRVVIPKAMRQVLGLEPGSQVSIESRDGHLELTAAPLDVTLQVRESLLVAVPKARRSASRRTPGVGDAGPQLQRTACRPAR